MSCWAVTAGVTPQAGVFRLSPMSLGPSRRMTGRAAGWPGAPRWNRAPPASPPLVWYVAVAAITAVLSHRVLRSDELGEEGQDFGGDHRGLAGPVGRARIAGSAVVQATELDASVPRQGPGQRV